MYFTTYMMNDQTTVVSVFKSKPKELVPALALSNHGYELGDKIGEGGSNEVYEVFDQTGNLYAAKIPRNLRNNLDLEFEILRNINSDYLLGIVDYLPSRPNVMVTDYIDKESFIEEPVSLEDSINIGKQLANVLQRVQDYGYIHGDLKPSNMAYNQDVVTLFDFDSAYRIGATHRDELRWTPSFVSPEQVRLERFEPEMDQFMLGALLQRIYERTNSVPFKFKSTPNGMETYENVKKAIEYNERNSLPLEPISGTEEDFFDIISRLTENDPKRRFDSMEDVENRLVKLFN